MAEEHGVAGGPAHHAQHRQPHVRQGLRGEPGALQIKNHADEGRSAIIKAGECSVLTLHPQLCWSMKECIHLPIAKGISVHTLQCIVTFSSTSMEF